MALPPNFMPLFRASLIGLGLGCSALALAASAQDAPEAETQAQETQGQAAARAAAADLAAGQDDEPRILEAPAPDARRVYVNDPAHFAAITQQFVIDGEAGRVIGMIDGGFLPNPVVADDGSFIAHASTVFSRIARGERTDYVEVFDPVTLLPTADIELPDAPRFLVGTYPWMTSLTPDGKTLLFYQFSPAPAVGVVDLEGKAFKRMLDVPDCYHIFPTAPDTFFMHCRDGSLAKVAFGTEGTPEITHTEVFHPEDEFLINHPAYSQKAGRLVWPTYTGKIHQIDLSSGDAKFLPAVEALTEAERADGWRPGGWQQVAYHRALDRIYLLVDQRDEWRHKTASRFVVVLDAKTGERLAKFEMGHEIDSINVSQDEKPLLYALSTGDKTLYIHDAESGEELRSVNQLGHGPQVITTADMG
ncbi:MULTISPECIES: methylamine dehydrogenase (amicyanin) large subunit [Paracoccus]|jgi:methylamine dehydrogenase heavy chain|uniref:methylamine dehydrogenase (amicyanin) large subunit n=1 Tax=Paracoccus TaxID=265 RepID=UPI00258F48DF|nr:methylamine dehydrogenase (amicyanin) large subunit [Paracoccus sp. (in: a-proteobacteria)]